MCSDRNTPITGHRLARGSMYACLAASGVVLWFIPIPFMENLVGMTYAVIATFLIVGGLVSSAGHMLRIIVVERAGYPLLLTALTSLCATLFKESDAQAARIFIALVVFALTLGLYGRWRDLGTLRKQQVAQAHEEGLRDGSG